MLIQNEFEAREEVIFIEYDKVIKNSDQFLIQKLGGELSSIYSSFLETEALKGINKDNALGMSAITKHHNIFDSLRKVDLPDGWVHSYMDLYKTYPNMFDECDALSIGANLHMMLKQKFIKRVILWSPFEDERIITDIRNRHGDIKNLEYFHGNITDVFKLIDDKITSFIIANSELLPFIKDYDKIDFTEILLAGYRFNTKSEKDNFTSKFDIDYFGDSVVRFSTFEPFKPRVEHFNQIIKND